MLTQHLSCAPPGGLEVSEQNLDSNGNIKVAEQGVVTADVTFPVTQTVDGEVAATQSGTWNVGITGTPTVEVSNLPSAATVTGGQTGRFAFETGSTVFTIADGALLTDLVARWNDRTCSGIQVRTGDGLAGILYEPGSANEIDWHLTTGVAGPLTVSIGARGTGVCSGTLFWTGVSTS